MNLSTIKKLDATTLCKLFNLKSINRSKELIQKVCSAFKDRIKISKIKKGIERKRSLAQWVCTRLKVLVKMKARIK